MAANNCKIKTFCQISAPTLTAALELVSGCAIKVHVPGQARPFRFYDGLESWLPLIAENLCYIVTLVTMSHGSIPLVVERVQTGVRIEKRLLKVLRSLADYHDLSLGDLIEGIVLHAFEGKTPFGDESLARIAELKRIFGLDLTAAHAHRLREASAGDARRTETR